MPSDLPFESSDPDLEPGDVAFLLSLRLRRSARSSIGGLPKELLVPFAEQTRDLEVGERVAIGVFVDNTGRFAGTMKIREMLTDNGEFGLRRVGRRRGLAQRARRRRVRDRRAALPRPDPGERAAKPRCAVKPRSFASPASCATARSSCRCAAKFTSSSRPTPSTCSASCRSRRRQSSPSTPIPTSSGPSWG